MSEDASALPRNGCCNGQKMEDEFFFITSPRSDFSEICVHSGLGRKSFITEQLVALDAKQ